MDLTAPLLASQPSDPPHVILTVDPHPSPESSAESLEFPGIGRLPAVPAASMVDPFRNHTARIEGVYEWLKIAIYLPIAVARLVVFGLAILVGFVATKTALEGWKDKQNPMPKWRCRIMWVHVGYAGLHPVHPILFRVIPDGLCLFLGCSRGCSHIPDRLIKNSVAASSFTETKDFDPPTDSMQSQNSPQLTNYIGLSFHRDRPIDSTQHRFSSMGGDIRN